ncbi:MAG: 4-phosphoerythronate dehydrogenase PdxB [Bacteroides sp.]
MKVVIDDKIPYIKEAIEKIADKVVYLPGTKFTPEVVKDADALIVRTRTHCNQQLLAGSSVKFIATATIGYDHIDTEYCKKAGIQWTNAPGCNSSSVAQYIHSTLLLLRNEKGITLKNACIGIVGVGNVGSKVKAVAESLGMRVLLNDPPRADESKDTFCDLATIAQECDIITFHTPLNREGKYKTFHLADEKFFNSLGKQAVIINTSRGEVVETFALLQALNENKIKEAVIDVWENEPDINLSLLNSVFLGTPHIAGYSADGKANATRMSLESLCRFFHLPQTFKISPPAPETFMLTASDADEAYLKMYNPHHDSEALKSNPKEFETLRGNYPLRREKEAYQLK